MTPREEFLMDLDLVIALTNYYTSQYGHTLRLDDPDYVKFVDKWSPEEEAPDFIAPPAKKTTRYKMVKIEDEKEESCNFCGTPDLENPKKKCARTIICTNEPEDDT